MSTEAVTQFLTKISQEENLQNKMTTIGNAERQEDRLNSIVMLGSEHGYEFSDEEFRCALRDFSQKIEPVQESENLSEEELKTACGGTGAAFTVFTSILGIIGAKAFHDPGGTMTEIKDNWKNIAS